MVTYTNTVWRASQESLTMRYMLIHQGAESIGNKSNAPASVVTYVDSAQLQEVGNSIENIASSGSLTASTTIN